MKETVFLNDRFISFAQAGISVTQPGLLCGLGLFETMCARHKKIFYLRQHLERIRDGALVLGIRLPYGIEKLKKIIAQTLSRNSLADAYVRLTIWKERDAAGILVLARRYRPYPPKKYIRGFTAGISGFRQENLFLAGLKSTSRALYELSLEQAKKRGFDEALVLNYRGELCEGSRSNLFFAKNKELFTPALGCGCLPGITRRVIFDLAKRYKIKICEGRFRSQDLFEADEAFLTNSLIGIMPLAAVEKKKIGRARCRKFSEFFLKKYRSLLK